MQCSAHGPSWALSMLLNGFETNSVFYMAGSLFRGEAPLVQKAEAVLSFFDFLAIFARTKLEWVERKMSYDRVREKRWQVGWMRPWAGRITCSRDRMPGENVQRLSTA